MRFGTIVVVGGGCYGSYYVRQLERARVARRLDWARLLVVDRNPACSLGQAESRPASVTMVSADWTSFFAEYLASAAVDAEAHANDAIVPSPLMPHLLFDWLQARARARWPGRIRAAVPGEFGGIPWQKAGADGTRYVSYATWMCPINCIEPAKCPHTRGPRDWNLHEALAVPSAPAAVLRVTHRAYGVGMVDVADVLAADRMLAERLPHVASILVATASHCHGAVAELKLDGAVSPH